MSTYGEFDLNGWHFKAEMPDSDDEPRQWTITFSNPEGLEHVRSATMLYAPIFGPDIDDVATLNETIEAVIEEYAIE